MLKYIMLLSLMSCRASKLSFNARRVHVLETKTKTKGVFVFFSHSRVQLDAKQYDPLRSLEKMNILSNSN